MLAHFNMGCVLERMGKRRAAIKELEHAVDLRPDSADAHLNLALLYEADGQSQKTRDHLTQYFACNRKASGRNLRVPNCLPREERVRGKIMPFRRG